VNAQDLRAMVETYGLDPSVTTMAERWNRLPVWLRFFGVFVIAAGLMFCAGLLVSVIAYVQDR
jgi:hypothetical protein